MASILSNTFIASAGRVLNILLGIVVTALITRHLGTSQYGMYVLVLSYGTMFQIVADFGLYLSLTRIIAQHPTHQQRTVAVATSLRLVLLITAFLLAILLALFIPAYQSLVPALAIVAVGLTMQSLSQLLMGVFQARGVIWRAAAGDLAGRIVQLAGVLLFPFLITSYQLPITSYPLLYMTVMFTIGAGAAYLIHSVLVPAVKPWHLKWSWPEWKWHIRSSWPLAVMLVLNVIYFRVDVVMLSWFRSTTEVGLYGLAYRIIEAGLFFPAMFGGLLLPKLSHTYLSKNRHRVSNYLSQSIHMMLVFGSMALLLLVGFAQPIVVFLSGEAYQLSAPLLRILALALFIMFFGNVFGFALVAFEKQKQLMLLYAALVGVNVIANIVFIPLYGATAAAWTTVATEAASAIIAGWLVYSIVPYYAWWAAVGKVALMVVACGLLISILPQQWHVLMQIVVTVCFFTAVGVLLKVVRLSQVKLLIHP